MVDRKVQWDVLIVAGLLTITLVGGLYAAGMHLNDSQINTIEQEVREFNIQQKSQDLARQLASNLPKRNCEALTIAVEQTIEDVQGLQKKVATYEQTSKVKQEDFKTLKRHYTNLLLEYWLTTKRVEQNCGSSVLKILYLYSDEQKCERCEDQGTILTHYRQKYDDSLLVFPLDTTLEMQTVNLITDAYDITRYPSLIIDGDAYTGFKDKQELGRIIETHMNRTNMSKTGQ